MTLTADEVRARLAQLREHDLPTHGGRTLAYVYDSGLAEVDAISSLLFFRQNYFHVLSHWSPLPQMPIKHCCIVLP